MPGPDKMRQNSEFRNKILFYVFQPNCVFLSDLATFKIKLLIYIFHSICVSLSHLIKVKNKLLFYTFHFVCFCLILVPVGTWHSTCLHY